MIVAPCTASWEGFDPEPFVLPVGGPDNVEGAVQTDPLHASETTDQKKCWELLAETCDWFQTLRNNSQQHPTTCTQRTVQTDATRNIQ